MAHIYLHILIGKFPNRETYWTTSVVDSYSLMLVQTPKMVFLEWKLINNENLFKN